MPMEIVAVISAQHALFDGLRATNEMVHRTLDEKTEDIELSDAVEKARLVI